MHKDFYYNFSSTLFSSISYSIFLQSGHFDC